MWVKANKLGKYANAAGIDHFDCDVCVSGAAEFGGRFGYVHVRSPEIWGAVDAAE